MSDFGVTSTGFVPKTLADILSDLESAQKAAPEIGPNQDFSSASALGQLNGILGSVAAELWELGEAVYDSRDPDAATDVALTVVASLTGTARRADSATTVLATLVLDPGITVPAGSLASIATRPDLQFQLLADVTNSSGARLAFTGHKFQCTSLGPIACNAGTLTVIDTTIPGWVSVTNPADGLAGRNADADIPLRQRRVDQLALRGGSTVGAVKADLLDFENHPELTGIVAVLPLNNPTDSPDADGVPAHSYEIVLDDGVVPSVANNDVAQVIFDNGPPGVASAGQISATATDANGDPQNVHFSRREALNVYVTYSLTLGPSFPSDGEAQVRARFLAAGNALQIGEGVIALQIRAAAFAVPGVVDVPVFELGLAPSPTSTANIPVTKRQRAIFDSTRLVRV